MYGGGTRNLFLSHATLLFETKSLTGLDLVDLAGLVSKPQIFASPHSQQNHYSPCLFPPP